MHCQSPQRCRVNLEVHSLGRAVSSILDIGVAKGMTTERRRIINSANTVHLLALCIGLYMLFKVLRLNVYQYLPLAVGVCLAALGCFALMHKRGYSPLPTALLMWALTLIFLHATATGTGAGTAYLWLFVFPYLTMLTFGLRRGLVVLGAQIVCLAAIFFLPGDPFLRVPYPQPVRESIFAAYLVACCAVISGEYTRSRAYQTISTLMRQLKEASQTDELTGLYNRRAFNERLSHEKDRSVRNAKPFCIALCDIDYFKKVNDTYGHNCGDKALQHLSEILRSHVRKQDTVARWGGEEFILLLAETPLEGGVTLAEKLRKALLASPCHCEGYSIPFTISIGVHECVPSENLETHIAMADAKLYAAKKAGRNRVCATLVAEAHA